MMQPNLVGTHMSLPGCNLSVSECDSLEFEGPSRPSGALISSDGHTLAVFLGVAALVLLVSLGLRGLWSCGARYAELPAFPWVEGIPAYGSNLPVKLLLRPGASDQHESLAGGWKALVTSPLSSMMFAQPLWIAAAHNRSRLPTQRSRTTQQALRHERHAP